MSTFQSYLIVDTEKNRQRETTQKLAKSLDIELEKDLTDVYFIKAPKAEISIEQIRQLQNHIFQKPLQKAHKFIVLEDAQNATPEAQNALLKILEEPPNHAIIVLEAQNKELLLPTILSRLTQIKSQTQSQRPKEKKTTLLELSLESALEQVSTIENPGHFLDDQIITLSELLVNSATQNTDHPKVMQIQKAIASCTEAKQMIAANVNPTFVLTSLVFTLTNE